MNTMEYGTLQCLAQRVTHSETPGKGQDSVGVRRQGFRVAPRGKPKCWLHRGNPINAKTPRKPPCARDKGEPSSANYARAQAANTGGGGLHVLKGVPFPCPSLFLSLLRNLLRNKKAAP